MARPLTPTCTVTLNADLGEGYPNDERMYPLLDMANIACGGHAGDESTVAQACAWAKQHGVQAGAHPSYPDREGFGRRRPPGPLPQLLGELRRQMDCFENTAARLHLKTRHFKPHGQLYNDAAFNPDLAGLVIRLAQEYPHLTLVALAHSPLVNWAEEAGVDVLQEAFADRLYRADGSLTPRTQPGAVFESPTQVLQQAQCILLGQPVTAQNDTAFKLQADTLCLHGDTDHAYECTAAVRAWMNSHFSP